VKRSKLFVAAALVPLAALAAVLAAVLAIRAFPRGRSGVDRVVAIFKEEGSGNAFWTCIRSGIETGAQDYGFEVSFLSPSDETAIDEQILILEGAVAERPAAILLAAADVRRLVDPVRRAKAAGLKVVCVDSFIESDDADAMIGTDNFEAGQKCGAALLELLPSGARVAVMSYVRGSSTAIGRENGLRAALGDRARIQATTHSGSEEETAYEQARGILSLRPAPDGIAALNLPTLAGAARALAESGLEGSVVLVGVDSSPEIAKYLERGVIRDAIVQKPFNMGYISMRIIRDILSGKKVPKYVNTGSADIDKANMFDAANQKLLFPVSAQ
jgi:ribose transport system substrate-binding protein